MSKQVPPLHSNMSKNQRCEQTNVQCKVNMRKRTLFDESDEENEDGMEEENHTTLQGNMSQSADDLDDTDDDVHNAKTMRETTAAGLTDQTNQSQRIPPVGDTNESMLHFLKLVSGQNHGMNHIPPFGSLSTNLAQSPIPSSEDFRKFASMKAFYSMLNSSIQFQTITSSYDQLAVATSDNTQTRHVSTKGGTRRTINHHNHTPLPNQNVTTRRTKSTKNQATRSAANHDRNVSQDDSDTSVLFCNDDPTDDEKETRSSGRIVYDEEQQAQQEEEWFWPNGTCEYTLPEYALGTGYGGQKVPVFGHALCQLSSRKEKDYYVKRYYCLGVYECPVEGCMWKMAPRYPLSKKIGEKPRPPKYTCPRHISNTPVWRRCLGGEHKAFQTPMVNQPCAIIARKPLAGDQPYKIYHYGTHNHERPPNKKIQPAAKQKFEAPSHPHASFAGLLEMKNKMPEPFFYKWQFDDDMSIISLQTPYMREVLLEATSGLQTDTVEGVINDISFSGKIDIHFTSAYEPILRRWVPVLISILFGREKQDYHSHWITLFESYGAEANKDYESFKKAFPGVTTDWSSSLGLAFIDAIKCHARSMWRKTLSTDTSG